MLEKHLDFFFPFLLIIGGVGRGKPPENSVTGKKNGL